LRYRRRCASGLGGQRYGLLQVFMLPPAMATFAGNGP
jgi:hypothetical protein